MAEQLADGNVALALLGNTLATGCILVVLDFDIRADFRRPLQSGRHRGHGSAR